jgi:hypothetical protein
MRVWLAAAGAVPLVVSFSADAGPLEPATGQSPTAPSFAIPATPQFKSGSSVDDGMIAQDEVAPNVHVGFGLAPMLGRNIHSVRIEQEPVPTRNPGVSFVLKFPG